ncbi:Hsp20/alpha crystallin family protein [Paractinoplanes hotanensis]|uniref:Hsp20/alpha crystallin family protein n=1 Tax=Paractinoplanes hotanensis TaxID=2906497 RepID=A0ABT0XXM5_9ACTN|nr:Hsp20/alpha crystallin family protein [Actinoplanes hotanensis]MCM4078390.1 Hsp20/alpha crystallin family protein [Actinoplanes hotanensis]
MSPHGATVRELDQLTCRVFDSTRSSGARLAAYRIDGTFYVDIDLPGIDKAGIDISVDDGVLTVRAERRAGAAGSAASIAGPATREVDLSESESLDTDRLEALCDNGVVTLHIPVVHEPRTSELAAVAA